MDKKMYRVTMEGITREFPEGMPYGNIVEAIKPDTQYAVMLVMVNGRLRELHKTLKESCELVPITTADNIGHKTYKRSMTLLMLKAVYHVAGYENIRKVVIHYSVSDGYYYTIQGNVKITPEFLEQVEDHMRRIVEEKLPILKRSVDRGEASRIFHKHGMYEKEQLFRFRRVSRVNIYSLDGFEDYYYGFMAWHTGYLKYFKLIPYDEGVVLQMPKQSKPDEVPEFKPSPKVFAIQKESEKWGEMLKVDMVGALNNYISRNGIQKLMLIGEALQEGKISAIAEKISSRRDVKFIMIAGPSSSGKTTFSQRLSIQLAAHGMNPHTIAVDNYFKNREETPLDEFGKKNYECLEAVDVDGFNRDMSALLKGNTVEIPRFNFVDGRREYKGDYMQLGPDDVLVIEGIHGLNDELSYALPKMNKFKIYISALTQLNVDEHNRIPTTDGRLLRRIVRDNRTRGTSAQETIAMWSSVRRGEEQYIFPFQEEADIIYNSALIYELAVLKLYAEPLLFQIQPGCLEYYEAVRLLKFLDYFVGVPGEDIPRNSILREFIGGSCFLV
ncbi:nucleoside kinase [Ruminococcus sp. OA3]|uniref:nucleoside kinase n=1 Tax=Ruminococcus sp. OA3 TaxID=2914164 RepID=UPI001F0688C9|nr:nucleoside kinase [Ruminococcus sp. OA3]MCH1983911.1 nucleoside kinase [Ruminococcus sp. OA3]